MKLLLVLGLVTITMAGFCIEGIYHYNYSDCGCCGSNNNGTMITNSMVNAIRGNKFMMININELMIGDMVKSHDCQYTEVLYLNRYNMTPEIVTPHPPTCSSNVAGGSVFTNSTPYDVVTVYKYKYNNSVSYVSMELVEIPHNVINITNSRNEHNCVECSSCICNHYTTQPYISCHNEYVYQYLSYGSDFINYINDNNLINNCVSFNDEYNIYHNLTIYGCEAIEVTTANGYIMVNDILFRN